MAMSESTGLKHNEVREALVCCFISTLVCPSSDMGEGSALNIGGVDQMGYHSGNQNHNLSSTFLCSSDHILAV